VVDRAGVHDCRSPRHRADQAGRDATRRAIHTILVCPGWLPHDLAASLSAGPVPALTGARVAANKVLLGLDADVFQKVWQQRPSVDLSVVIASAAPARPRIHWHYVRGHAGVVVLQRLFVEDQYRPGLVGDLRAMGSGWGSHPHRAEVGLDDL
jgi:hypothetical protein